MTFQKTLRDIISLKIQGAEHVATTAAEAIVILAKKNKHASNKVLKKRLLWGEKKLYAARVTEPMMRNVLAYLLADLPQENSKVILLLDKKLRTFKAELKKSQRVIAQIVAKKINNNSVVYTHCHSSSVTRGLILAKKKKKKFKVHNTETRPLFQGRITAVQLAKSKIVVMHYVDAAMRIAIKKADIIFLGADAITTTKVYNKIGSEIVAEYAERYNIPLYICTNSLKFDPLHQAGHAEPIEYRSWREVWRNKPQNVTVVNPAFEAVSPQLITGIISEYGILSHAEFVSLMMKKIKKIR